MRARKLLPRKNIFTRETQRSRSKTNPGRKREKETEIGWVGKGEEKREKRGKREEKSTSPTEQDRDVDAAVKTSKSRRTGEFTETRFMDYRSSVRDLSNAQAWYARAELSRSGFRQTRLLLHALDENTFSDVGGGNKKKREKIATPHPRRKHNLGASRVHGWTNERLGTSVPSEP